MKWHRCDFQVQTPEDSQHWADAETKLGVIYAVEAKDGGHVLAQGGLDRPKVTRAVDVMERSEEAFKRRS